MGLVAKDVFGNVKRVSGHPCHENDELRVRAPLRGRRGGEDIRVVILSRLIEIDDRRQLCEGRQWSCHERLRH